MTAVELFEFHDHHLRAFVIDGRPWFVAADAARILGFRDAANAARLVREHHRGTHPVSTPGGTQQMTVVSLPGLNRLVMRSDVALAEPFQDWVTDEVLPQIQTTGSYSAKPALPQTYAEALRELASSVEERDRLAAEVAELAPAAHSWHVLADASGDYDLRAAAQCLSRDPAIRIGQNQLAALLRELRWVDERSRRPYQAQINNGRLAVRVSDWTDPDTGEVHVRYQARITPKGLEFLHRHLGGTEPLDNRQLALVEPAS